MPPPEKAMTFFSESHAMMIRTPCEGVACVIARKGDDMK